jgi:glyoxylase-like metal-dependent hydrolase (beta-lactamase superfamily II)
MPSTDLVPGVVEIDTLLGGWQRINAGYLIEGPRPVLVETGSQSSIEVLLASLAELGVDAGDLAGVVVTHIHLDHAGGVGDVARAFPQAKVYVHENGARHLVDPTRLVRSAARTYGPLLDSLFGRLSPTPSERVNVLRHGEEIDIGGGRSLRAIDSPGVGVRLPDGGALRPATPPPDFDLDAALSSLRRFADARPSGIALAHYGLVPGEPQELLAEAEAALLAWAGEAERAWRAGEDMAEALALRFAQDTDGLAPERRRAVETLGGVHSNAAGLRRWFERELSIPEV